MSRYDFLVATYETERLKTLSVWSHFVEEQLSFRIEPRARTPREQMVHQCVSEDVWMTGMLGLEIGWPALPGTETRQEFLTHYAEASLRRLRLMQGYDDGWFEGVTRFFDVDRSRAWVLTRRIAHTSHHRGQMTILLRALGQSLHSTYGPTADTGGLFQHGAPVIYRYPDVESLLADAATDQATVLPGPGPNPVTERGGA